LVVTDGRLTEIPMMIGDPTGRGEAGKMGKMREIIRESFP
jgi:hypothetical protein